VPEEGVVSRDVTIPTSDGHSIPVRIYHPKGTIRRLPLYIHLHGGGWLLGNIETEDVSCRLISLRTNTVVMNINYRHTPEWTFPTPVQDAWDALHWITQVDEQHGVDKDCIIIGGTSSGASLACATALRDLENVHLQFHVVTISR
jgi:acetyl esterase/lipase